MLPPSSWVEELTAAGHAKSIFPFLYPPLWAWVAGLLTRVTDYTTLVQVGNITNPLLLCISILLAARLTGAGKNTPVFLLAGLLISGSTTISLVALEQNQPQILVAFLCVLAIERVKSRAPLVGGLALALAASIKLYPVLFVLFWLARRERKAALSFAGFGAMLAALSVVVAGWSLHAEFLEQVRMISGTVLAGYLSYSFDPVIGYFAFRHDMYMVYDLNPLSDGGWHVMAKPALWKALNAMALLIALAALFRLARGRTGDDPLFWPLAFTVIALLSPLSWSYSYIAPMAFMPALLFCIGPAKGILVLIALISPTSSTYLASESQLLPLGEFGGALGTLSMVAYAGLLWAIVADRRPGRVRALAPS